MNDLVSIIVPVYNSKKSLVRCVKSILNQSYKNIEIILVDDGSTDGSEIICDKFAEHNLNIKTFHKKNGGLSDARNYGIQHSSGMFLGFVDSDDWISQVDYKITNKMTHLIQKKEHIICIDGEEEIVRQYLADGMKKIKSYPVWTKLYKRCLFDNISFPNGKLYEDVVTNFDVLCNANRYVISNRVCYFYFNGSVSITRGNFTKHDFDYLDVGDDILKRVSDNSKLIKYGKMTLARTHFMCLCKMIKYGAAPDINIVDSVSTSLDVLRNNFFYLIKSKMELNRKVLLFMLCLNKRVIVKIISGRQNENIICND